MKIQSKMLLLFVALICSASPALALDGNGSNVPESFSTLWLALPVVSMIGLTFLGRKKP